MNEVFVWVVLSVCGFSTFCNSENISFEQGKNAIALRDPAIHRSGERALFSMVVGAPTQQLERNDYYWQMY